MLAKLTTILLLATMWALPVATHDDTVRDDTRRERGRSSPERGQARPKRGNGRIRRNHNILWSG